MSGNCDCFEMAMRFEVITNTTTIGRGGDRGGRGGDRVGIN